LRSAWVRFRLWPWQAKEAAGFVGDVVEIGKTATFTNDIEQITVFTRAGVGPFAGGAFTGFGSFEPDEHGTARGVSHVAHQPIDTLAATVEEIVAAYRLGIARETVRQFGSTVAHRYAAARSAMRSTG
jgi:hypothetical protein